MFETDVHDNDPKIERGATRDLILAAALRILARDGYGKLTARAVAAEAGTNIASLNYHFGSKRKFLPELYAAIERDKYARQRAMYADPSTPLSAKWRQATAYYRQDLADGYVRIIHEQYALGHENPEIATLVQGKISSWQALIEEAVRRYLPALGITAPPEMIASAVASFWLGMEVQHLAGASEQTGHYFAILDAVGDWLEAREAEAAARASSVEDEHTV
jgi:AcrR family transcriptional regulator